MRHGQIPFEPIADSRLANEGSDAGGRKADGGRRRAEAPGPFAALTATLKAGWSRIGSLSALPPSFARPDGRLASELAGLRALLEAAQDRAWELRESEERYRSLCEAFGDIVIHRDPADGRLIFANAAFDELFGGEPGMAFQPAPIEETGAAAALAGAARELCLPTKQGPRWFRWIDMPVRDERSGKAAIRSVARDITVHKQAEIALETARLRAEQANLAKSRFLATVSHEMRTPLNGILGMSALLADSQMTPEQRAYNDAIATSGKSLLALIEDMLDLTMIEAGRFEARPVTIAPARLVEDVCELLAPRAHAKGIELACHTDPRMPETVTVDAGRVRQVLVNLVGNAVKFTERGGVLVSVRAGQSEPADSESARLEFTIADTGPGVGPADRQRVFQDFVQADQDSTRRHGGVGLGLSISAGIARQLDGEIVLDGVEGSGSRFRLFVPAQIASGPAPVPTLRGRNILLVARGRTQSVAITGMVAATGGRIEYAETLKSAESLMRQSALARRFDTVVLADGMARNPARWLAKLRRSSSAAPLFAVVLVRPGERSRLAGLLAGGFDAYLVSPVRQNSFFSVLCDRRSDASHLAPPSDAARPLLATGETIRPRRILLAEDNDINALLVAKTLERAGQSVTLAGNGRDAVRACRAALAAGQPFELVLMDLHMPVLDGQDAIAAIRRLEAKWSAPRATILALSADAQPSVRATVRASGADGFLTKPVAPARLIDLLRGPARDAA